MDINQNNKCTLFINYVDVILKPAFKEFECKLDSNKLNISQVISLNFIVAHAIDYMIAIKKLVGQSKSRKEHIREFDELYSVEGGLHINKKFMLLDALNNAIKHVELDQNRYNDLLIEYGEISISCLKQGKGKVYFSSSKYFFDYARVVLRPIAATFECDIHNIEQLEDFLNGDYHGCASYGNYECYDDVNAEAIERMIDYANPQCRDCGEYEADCDCSSSIYNGKQGGFSPDDNSSFDFYDVWSQISRSKQ